MLQAANTSSPVDASSGAPDGLRNAAFQEGGELEWLTKVKYAIVETHEKSPTQAGGVRERTVFDLTLRALRAAGMAVLRTSVRGEVGLIGCGSMLPATRCTEVCSRLMEADLHINGPRGRFRCAPVPASER